MVSLGLPPPDINNPNRIRTPHAAIMIWNYDDRLGLTPAAAVNSVTEIFVSTLSCTSIRTNKSKSDPQGTFQVTLAPNRNWVSAITPGSWCAILMSNQPITEKDFITADPQKLKMIGKIDTVRVGTKAGPDGERNTMYYMSGVDWGHIFHNIMYIDNNLARPSDPMNLGNSAALAIQKFLFGAEGQPKRFSTSESITALMDTFGKDLFGFSAAGKEIGLLANAIYTFNIPRQMTQYLRLLSKSGAPIPASNLNGAIKLVTGALQSTEDTYTDTKESYGFIDPFSLQGAHTFWQVLLDNSNPTMNEMIAEMRPGTLGTSLNLYNRIKPFAVKGNPLTTAIGATPGGRKVLSYFQNILTHKLDPMTIKDVNAGTNWKDKYNFIEIKPQFQDQRILEASLKSMTQGYDEVAFQREGFRPLIYSTKHLPGPFFESSSLTKASWAEIGGWVQMLKAWYFDTHKMLNGTVEMTGIDGYIAVGDNIKFDSGLLNPNKNFTLLQSKTPGASYVVAHVENVSHGFTIRQDGSREYTTSIQFVRGIIVNEAGLPLATGAGPDAGAVDKSATLTPAVTDLNRSNTVVTPDKVSPSLRKPE